MRATHQHRRRTKIGIKQTTDRRKKKNREKNFSFRRFFLFLRFSVGRVVLPCHSERRSEGPESRNLPLPADLSTAAHHDKVAPGRQVAARGERAFGTS